MTDAPFTETHRETLKRLRAMLFMTSEDGAPIEAIDAALKEVDRLRRERDETQDAVLKAAKAGWALAAERLRVAIGADKALRVRPMTAEECLTMLENADLPTTLPEAR